MTSSKTSFPLALLLCLSAVTLTQQQNPFLKRKQQLQQHQIQLQKLHQQQLKARPQAPPTSPQDPAGRPLEPAPSDHHRSATNPAPPKSPAAPQWPDPQRGFQEENRVVGDNRDEALKGRGRGGRRGLRERGKQVMENRNEMHKLRGGDGDPVPTPWTRWTLHPRRRDNPWPDTGFGHVEASDLATCGRQGYVVREKICCQGSLHKRQGLKPACCGSVPFDLVFGLCCQGHVLAKTSRRPSC